MDIEDVTDWESRALVAERELKFRELHHAEVEQENERLKDALDKERAEHESTLRTGQAYLAELKELRDALAGL